MSSDHISSFCPAVYQNHYIYLCNIPCIYLYVAIICIHREFCHNLFYAFPAWQCTLVWIIKDQRWFAYASCLLPTYIIPYYTRSFGPCTTGIQCFGNPFQKLSSSAGICGSFVHLIHYRCEAFDNKAIILDLFCWCFFTLVPCDSSPLSHHLGKHVCLFPSKVHLVRCCPFYSFARVWILWIRISSSNYNSSKFT